MSRKKVSYSPEFDPTKSHKFCPGAQTGTRDKLAGLPLGVTKTSPKGPCWLTNQRPSLVCRSRLETPRAGLGPKKLRADPPLASPSERNKVTFTFTYIYLNSSFLNLEKNAVYEFRMKVEWWMGGWVDGWRG